MSEQQEPYVVVSPPVTITIPKEWADFLTRAQTARNRYRMHHIERIAVIDLQNLTIGKVIAFERD